MKRILFLSLLLTSNAFAGATRVLDGQTITNGSAVITLPTVTGTLFGKDESVALTNKTISGASNTLSSIPTSAIAGSALSGTNTGDVTIGTANGLSLTGQALSLTAASTSTTGALTSTDWNTFNGKLGTALTSANIFVGNGSNVATGVAMSGDVTISNTGATTIGNLKVTAAKMSSGAATSGQVATADGSGNVSYVTPASTAPSTSGTDASPTVVTAAGGVVFSGSNYSSVYFITAASAITVTATPQISAGSLVGQKLILISKSATNTITLADGNGLSLNGSWVGGLDSVLELVWNGNAKWVEVARR